jgi:hypothetical protein
MKIHNLLPLGATLILLAGCSSFQSNNGPKPTPTPASEEIAVLNADQLPIHYSVVGVVMGSSMEMLKDRARKLGADAIVNPKSVDPVTGWATTDAIKFDK